MRQKLPRLTRHLKTRVWRIGVPQPDGKNRWVSTGETDKGRALQVVLEHGVDRIVHLAHARVLTAESISIATMGRRGNCREIFDLWKERAERILSWRSAETYGGQIAAFMDQNGNWDQPIAKVTEAQIDKFVNDGTSGLATVSSRMASMRSFFRFAAQKGMLIGNPAELVEIDHRHMSVERMEKRKVLPFTEAEYQAIVRGASGYWRDWTVLAYCCGYRMTDCACMEWASFTKDSIIVYPKKSRRAARLEIPLGDPLIGRFELRELIDRLLSGPREHETYVWVGHARALMTPGRRCYSIHFARVLRKLGMGQLGKTFHSLRRSFACRLTEAGRTIDQVAAAMGHTNTANTEIYVNSAKNLPAVGPAGNPFAEMAAIEGFAG